MFALDHLDGAAGGAKACSEVGGDPHHAEAVKKILRSVESVLSLRPWLGFNQAQRIK